MWSKLRTLASLYRELGFRWSVFRVAYAFRLRTGIVRLQMPIGKWSDYKNHISNKPAGRVERAFFPILSKPVDLLKNIPWNPQTAIDEANRVLNGELKYFAHNFHRTGFPPNWHKAPISGIELDSKKHWSQISDDNVIARRALALADEAISRQQYDIKFIWEPNRFAFVYTLVRAYVASRDEKYAEAFWKLILDWAEHNPPNTGANWKDGQEIALRLMAWTFGYHAFIDSTSSTPERKAKFTVCIAAQTERIYKNISYAISTRSNHTISEAFGLWLVGLLFPELKDSDKYFSFGRKLLEQEAVAQIFPDGSYSMYSLNYHRFILHIYLYAIRLGEINHSPFSTQLINSVTKSIDYLSHLIDPQTGQMPFYGSNDGALVLPLNNCDFTDYRPLLQLGWFITKSQRLFEPGEWDEDIFWLCGPDSLSPRERAGVRKKSQSSFPHGGTYLLRGHNSKALIRCTDYTSRPSHADQLHVDIWIHGHNIAIEAGTYLYSGEGIWRNGFTHTSVHNTVTVDNKDQMTMVSRFTWTNWSKGKVLKHSKDVWQGEHDSYKPVSHERKVISLEGDRWLVIDDLDATEPHEYSLHWLLSDGDFELQEPASAYGLWLTPTKMDRNLSDSRFLIQMGVVDGNSKFSLTRVDPNSTRGWRSRYYGHKEPAISVLLEMYRSQVTFWSFFGFENDVVEADGKSVIVNSKSISLIE